MQKSSRTIRFAINCAVAAVIIIAVIAGTFAAYGNETQISAKLSPSVVKTTETEIESEIGQALSARIMEEGATLLRNENSTLPLDRKADRKVNVFGWRSIDWIYGSEGFNASGGVSPEKDISENVDIYKALNGYGISYNRALKQVYYDFRQPDLQSANLRGVKISELVPLCEPDIDDRNYYTEEVLEGAKKYSDVAIVVIGRMTGEGMNASSSAQQKRGPTGVNDTTRHYLEISKEEEKLLTYVGANFEKVIVLLNVANQFECGFLESINGLDACVYLGFTGTRALSSLPALLYGEVSFSGHTVDTFAYDMFTNPANIWGEKQYSDWNMAYEDYIEGIYVGYRWYETVDAEGYWSGCERETPAGKKQGYNAVVQYPFGYGLSYNEYEWTIGDISVKPDSDVNETTKITIPVKVKNNGEVPGREVIAAYVTAPYTKGGIEKSFVSLLAFTKTDVIEPKEEIETSITVSVCDFRSYDCYDKNSNGFCGYEIEQGEYGVKLMTDSHTVKTVNYNGEKQPAVFNYNVKDTIKLDKDPVTGKTVKNLFTGESAIDSVPVDGSSKDGSFTADIPWLTRESFLTLEEINDKNTGRKVTPEAKAVAGGTYTRAMADAWDSATTDAFGDPVSQTAPVWGKKNGLTLTDDDGDLNELALKLGADYNAPEWQDLLEQLTVSAVIDNLINFYYGTKAIRSIGKPKLTDLDGPAQYGGFASSTPGTGYPTMVTIASTWNPELAYEFGKSYGEDMDKLGGSGMWGWAIDSHRSAWFGRNHESPSEDPVLAGTIVANAVKGLSTKGKYCTIKHFALYGRGGNNKWLSEQALREIHLSAFRLAFVEGGALGCMTTYQGIGAEHTETSVALLEGVLRKEWDFKGAITTDYIDRNYWCESIIRCGGNLGMGVSLSSEGFMDYKTQTPSVRFQNRLQESAHQTLYMWLRANYYKQEYLKNPDKPKTVTTTTEIKLWEWWKPLLTCVDIVVIAVCAAWFVCSVTSYFKPDDKKAFANGQSLGDKGDDR